MIVSFGHTDGAGKSTLDGMGLARKSQGFGKICVESFPKYIKLFRVQDRFINSSGANDTKLIINL